LLVGYKRRQRDEGGAVEPADAPLRGRLLPACGRADLALALRLRDELLLGARRHPTRPVHTRRARSLPDAYLLSVLPRARAAGARRALPGDRARDAPRAGRGDARVRRDRRLRRGGRGRGLLHRRQLPLPPQPAAHADLPRLHGPVAVVHHHADDPRARHVHAAVPALPRVFFVAAAAGDFASNGLRPFAAATTVDPLLRNAATAGLMPPAMALPSPNAFGAAMSARFWFIS